MVEDESAEIKLLKQLVEMHETVNRNQAEQLSTHILETQRLRAELERVQSNHVTVAEEFQRRRDAVTPLLAEIERLRAALTEIAGLTHGNASHSNVAWGPDMARRALDRAKAKLGRPCQPPP